MRRARKLLETEKRRAICDRRCRIPAAVRGMLFGDKIERAESRRGRLRRTGRCAGGGVFWQPRVTLGFFSPIRWATTPRSCIRRVALECTRTGQAIGRGLDFRSLIVTEPERTRRGMRFCCRVLPHRRGGRRAEWPVGVAEIGRVWASSGLIRCWISLTRLGRVGGFAPDASVMDACTVGGDRVFVYSKISGVQ